MRRRSKADRALLAPKERCRCRSRKDDDGRPLEPDYATCGTCGFRWCMRCHPCPAARSWCEASDRHAELQELEDAERGAIHPDLCRALALAGAILTVLVLVARS